MGLAHRAVTHAELVKAVEEEVAMINLGGPVAVKECKRLVRAVSAWERDEAFAQTKRWSVSMFQSEEGAEGMAAFREKRSPNWIEHS